MRTNLIAFYECVYYVLALRELRSNACLDVVITESENEEGIDRLQMTGWFHCRENEDSYASVCAYCTRNVLGSNIVRWFLLFLIVELLLAVRSSSERAPTSEEEEGTYIVEGVYENHRRVAESNLCCVES